MLPLNKKVTISGGADGCCGLKKRRVLMTINKKELFDKTQALWPKVLKQEDLSAQPSLAQVLNDLYYRIEASVSENDHWMQISIWAYYQALPKKTDGEITDFSPHDVNFDEFDRMMVQNLNGDECWAEERNIYLALK